jgi:hypothetical protein
MDERVGRFDLADLARQQVERLGCTAKGEGGFHLFVLRQSDVVRAG